MAQKREDQSGRDVVTYYLRRGGLVGAERQVADEEWPGGAAGYRPAVDKHLIQGDGKSGVVAVNHHGGGVPHQADVYARCVDMDGGRVVVRRDDCNGLPPAILLT